MAACVHCPRLPMSHDTHDTLLHSPDKNRRWDTALWLANWLRSGPLIGCQDLTAARQEALADVKIGARVTWSRAALGDAPRVFIVWDWCKMSSMSDVDCWSAACQQLVSSPHLRCPSSAGHLLVSCWSSTGPLPIICWSAAIHLLVSCLSSAGQLRVICWTAAGHLLVSCLSSSGQLPVICWSSAGKVLVSCRSVSWPSSVNIQWPCCNMAVTLTAAARMECFKASRLFLPEHNRWWAGLSPTAPYNPHSIGVNFNSLHSSLARLPLYMILFKYLGTITLHILNTF